MVETKHAGRHASGQSHINHMHRPAYVDAAAGAMAGVVARFVVQPLDVLKIRFQVRSQD